MNKRGNKLPAFFQFVKIGKKGLNVVISVVLLVLISMIALAMVWTFVLPLFGDLDGKGGEGVFTASLKVVPGSVSVDSGRLSFSVQRGAGSGDVIGYNYIVKDADGGTVSGRVEEEMEEFERNEVSEIDVSSFGRVAISEIYVIPVLRGGFEGSLVEKFEVGEIGGDGCGDETCDDEEDCMNCERDCNVCASCTIGLEITSPCKCDGVDKRDGWCCDNGWQSEECKKYVFVTSVKGSGNLESWSDANGETGIEAGDEICRTLAESSESLVKGEGRTFKALLSDSITDAKTNIECDDTDGGPWYLVDGTTLVADDCNDLIDGNIQNAINMDESGTDLISTSALMVWTGSLNDLTKSYPDYCGDWQDFGSNGRFGKLNMTNWEWNSKSTIGCDSNFRLYCFEV